MNETLDQILDRALMAERGIQVECGTEVEAKRFRLRCYSRIRSDRAANRRSIGQDESEWQSLTFFIKGTAVEIRNQEPSFKIMEI